MGVFIPMACKDDDRTLYVIEFDCVIGIFEPMFRVLVAWDIPVMLHRGTDLDIDGEHERERLAPCSINFNQF